MADAITRNDIAEIWEALGDPRAMLARELAEADRPDVRESQQRMLAEAWRFATVGATFRAAAPTRPIRPTGPGTDHQQEEPCQ